MNSVVQRFFFLYFVISTSTALGQFEMADSTNKVVIKPFSPPVGAVIQNLLYTPAKVFIAPDIFGVNHNLLDYRGKSVVLYFFNKDCVACNEGLNALGELKKMFGRNIEIFAFSNETKKYLLEFYKDKKQDYNIMFNSKIFGEMMYAGSLGYPRLFYIDKEGYTTKIIPSETFSDSSDAEKLTIKTISEIERGK